MKISEILKKDFVISELLSDNKADILLELCKHLERGGIIKSKNALFNSLMDREKLGSTGIGENLAIPHAKTEEVHQITGMLGRSVKGVEFDSLDGRPAHFIFLLLIPLNSTGQHLKALARISRLFKNSVLRDLILKAKNPDEIYSLLIDEDSKFI